jgi:hypothetical protein
MYKSLSEYLIFFRIRMCRIFKEFKGLLPSQSSSKILLKNDTLIELNSIKNFTKTN